jgi:hypothetical protein
MLSSELIHFIVTLDSPYRHTGFTQVENRKVFQALQSNF